MDFFENFEILEMLSLKSMIVGCNKLNGRKFMLKQICDHKDLLEGYIKSYKDEKKKFERYMNQNPIINISELVDTLVNIVP